MTKPTLNQLPCLSSDYNLTSEQIEGFRQQGHILLRGVASQEEIAAYRPIINRVAAQFNTQTSPLEERDTYGKAFLQIPNLWRHDEAVKRFVLARRFGKIAAELLGVKGVRIYHDQALFKEPGGGKTPWHQDQYYWPLDTDNTITMWMPLVDVPQEVGSMSFASKSQELGYLGLYEISDKSDQVFDQIIREKQMQVDNYGALQAGDATWHYGWTLHGAPGNPTDKMREVMTIIYYADGTRVAEPGDNPARYHDLEQWLPGLKPGELAASEINPLAYP